MSMAKYIQVTCQGRWIAGNVDNTGNRVLYEGIEYDLLATGTRRINYQPINLCCYLRQEVFNFAFQDFHVTSRPQILLCIPNGAGRFFNGNDFVHMPG